MTEESKRQQTTRRLERITITFMVLGMLLMLLEYLLKRAGYPWEFFHHAAAAAFATGTLFYGTAIWHRLRLFPFRK